MYSYAYAIDMVYSMARNTQLHKPSPERLVAAEHGTGLRSSAGLVWGHSKLHGARENRRVSNTITVVTNTYNPPHFTFYATLYYPNDRPSNKYDNV